MRVSDSANFANTIFYLQQARARQADTQQQLASGKRISTASDDPIGFGRALDYRTTMAMLDQRQSSATFAFSQLNEVDSALQNASQTVLARAEELAVQMTNSTNGAAERRAAAEELKGLIAQMLTLANSKLGDQSLFSGQTTRGRLVGTAIAPPSAGAPATITAGSNDTLQLKVDGVSSGSITLTAGNYATGDTLATEVQTKINADPILTAAGKSVRVRFTTDHLVIASDSYGSSSTVTVIAGSARRSTGLAGGTISSGAEPFSLGVQTGGAARNAGGAVVSPGLVTDAGKLTFNDYLLKFTSATTYNIYNANSPVATGPAAANLGGGIVSKSGVNDVSQVTLDSYAVRFKNISTVQAGTNDQIRFDPGTGPVTATLAPGDYTGAQLAAQIKSALETVSGGNTYTVAFNEGTAKYSITNDIANGTPLSLLFSDPLSTAAALAGFNAVDKTGTAAGSSVSSDMDTTGAPGVTNQSNVFNVNAGTNVLNITAANNTLVVNDTAGGAGADTILTLAVGSYTGAQLATELAAKLNATRDVANSVAYTAAYESVTPRRFTINDPAGNANSLILKFADSRSTAAQILGSTPVTVTDTVGASTSTLNSDSGNSLYAADGNIDFDGLRVAIKDGSSTIRNGDVFTASQAATLISSNLYTSKAAVAFDGLQLSIDGTGATAPVAQDIFRVLSSQQYNGDTNDSAIEIGNNVTAATLLNGDSVFVGSNGGTDVFASLQSLTRALFSNNVDGIQTAHVSLASATNQILQSQGTIGARSNRLQGIQDGLDQSKSDIEVLLSGIEDIDFAKVASDLTIQQLALEAAAQSATRVLQSSLLDFLR